jgi:hypothetical protein
MDPVADLGFPEYDPKYNWHEDKPPISSTDDATFCTHVLIECQKKGLAKNVNRDQFVQKCRNSLPEIALTEVDIGGSKYFWEYRNAAGNWKTHYPESRNVFSAFRAESSRYVTLGTVSNKAASDLATPERCRDFSDGDSGMKPQTAPARAPATKRSLLAPTARVADQIGFGVSVILGGIILFLTKGALPPLRAPVTPSFTPTIGSEYRRYPDA